MAEYLASELGRTPVFVQNQWDNLPELLKRPNLGRDDDIDIVLNGYEFSKERHDETPTTVPYYVYTFRLIGRRDDAIDGIVGRARRSRPEKAGRRAPRVGVAEVPGGPVRRRHRSSFPTETVTEQLDLVRDRAARRHRPGLARGRLLRAGGRYQHSSVVDEPVGTGYYVILTRPGDDDLREKLNDAHPQGRPDRPTRNALPEVRPVGRQPATAQLPGRAAVASRGRRDRAAGGGRRPAVSIRLSAILGNLFRAAGMTLALAVTSFPLAMLLGLIVASAGCTARYRCGVLAAVYVEVIRGTPLLLQLFVIFYLVPQLGQWSGSETLTAILSFPPFWPASSGWRSTTRPHEAENYRAGLLAIPRGQMEAALALGMTPVTAIRRVIVPQAVRIVIPPVTNDFIALFKDTSVCSVILITELTGQYNQYNFNRDLVVELAVRHRPGCTC